MAKIADLWETRFAQHRYNNNNRTVIIIKKKNLTTSTQ